MHFSTKNTKKLLRFLQTKNLSDYKLLSVSVRGCSWWFAKKINQQLSINNNKKLTEWLAGWRRALSEVMYDFNKVCARRTSRRRKRWLPACLHPLHASCTIRTDRGSILQLGASKNMIFFHMAKNVIEIILTRKVNFNVPKEKKLVWRY